MTTKQVKRHLLVTLLLGLVVFITYSILPPDVQGAAGEMFRIIALPLFGMGLFFVVFIRLLMWADEE